MVSAARATVRQAQRLLIGRLLQVILYVCIFFRFSYDDFAYDGLYLSNMLNNGKPFGSPPTRGLSQRFTLDLRAGRVVSATDLFSSHKTAVEFSQFNHLLEGLHYRWGYGVIYGMATDSRYRNRKILTFPSYLGSGST